MDLRQGKPGGDRDSCPACGGESRAVQRLRDVDVTRCIQCELVWCPSVPDSDSLSSGRNSTETAPNYTAGLLERASARAGRYESLARNRFGHYADVVGAAPAILEIGCGTAGLARPFTDLGATYTGIDLDPRVVAGADHSGPWTVMSGDIFELRDSLGPYDVVVASQVLEHLLDPAAFVEVVHGLLRPGGMVHVDVPSHWALAGLPSRMSSALARRQNRYGAITPPHHCMAFSRESLGTLFSSRFSAKTFSASSADGTWGQALTSGLLPSAYFALSRLPRVGNLCVLLGTAV